MTKGRTHKPIPVGTEFERLTVREFMGVNRNGFAIYRCECSCGNEHAAIASMLRSGSVRSCGCLAREQAALRCKNRLTTHGLTKHPLYDTWRHMMDRCYDKNCPAYHAYGARGIRVHEAWHDVKEFVKWVESNLGARPTKVHSIDRYPNGSGNYEPGNLRWADRREQARNTRRNVFLTLDGVTKLMVEWSEDLGISLGTLSARVKAGWSDKRVLTEPVRTRSRHSATNESRGCCD